MYCFQCGASMPDTSTSCPKCGAATTTGVSTPTRPLASPTASAAPAPALSGTAPQPYRGQPQTDGKAVASLILGVLSLCLFWFLTGIPAIILGHKSRKSIRESLGRLQGEGMALAGLVMGYISLATFIPVILIIAAIAIPSLIRSKMIANEAAAASTVRAIQTAQVTYQSTYNKGYAPDLATLGSGSSAPCAKEGTAEHACLLEPAISSPSCTSGSWCARYGYKFNVTGTCEADGSCSDYVIVATPVSPGTSGRKSFCSTSDLVIREQAGIISIPPAIAKCQSWLRLR